MKDEDSKGNIRFLGRKRHMGRVLYDMKLFKFTFKDTNKGWGEMEKEWEIARDSLSQITVLAYENNEPVTIHGHSHELKCIGVGTDAAVFQSVYAPSYAFKVFAETAADKINIERKIYDRIGESPFFPACFDSTERYLVISYEKGTTLFDCILRGIHIPEQVIKDVDKACEDLRQKGLNPRDIHLKNILLYNGRAKILDVSEYLKPGNDFRWEHLKEAYERYYPHIDGRPVPFWIVETVRKWYHSRKKYFSSYDDFMKYVLKLSLLAKKES